MAHSEHMLPFSLISHLDRSRLPKKALDAYPLSTFQSSVFFHHDEFVQQNIVYYDIFSYHLKAPLELTFVEQSILNLLQTFPILHTSFDFLTFDNYLQIIHQDGSLPTQVEDISHLSLFEQEQALSTWIDNEKKRSFSVDSASLLRLHIHIRSKEMFQLTVSFHRALLDGQSVAVLVTTFLQYYYSLLRQEPLQRDPLPFHTFHDFIALERHVSQLDEYRQYWRGTLQESSFTPLPRWASFSHETRSSKQKATFAITSELFQRLHDLAYTTGVSLKSVLLAGHVKVLSILSGQADVLTGLASDGRPDNAGEERALGTFFQTLPFRLQLRSESWQSLIHRTYEIEKASFHFRHYPLTQIQQDTGKHTLFESVFHFRCFSVYQQRPASEHFCVLHEKYIEEVDFPFVAYFVVNHRSDGMEMQLTYDTGTFTNTQVEVISQYYHAALTEMVQAPWQDHAMSTCMPPHEEALLRAWSCGRQNSLPLSCLHQQFEIQAASTPDAIALLCEGSHISYQALNRQANHLAHHLHHLGVGPERLVGLYMERSLEICTVILGILKAGGVCLPLDPSTPVERQRAMLNNASLVVSRVPHAIPQDIPIIELTHLSPLEELPDPPIVPLLSANAAYIIYTLDVAGQLKGVVITHENVSQVFAAVQTTFAFGPQDIWSLFTSSIIAFSTWEIWGTFLSGGKGVLVPFPASRYPERFGTFLKQQHITILHQFSSAFQQLLCSEQQATALEAVRLVMLSGEPLEAIALKACLSRYGDQQPQLINMYGMNEVTRYVAGYSLSLDDLRWTHCNMLGKPLANMQIYVLDASGQLAPIGVVGEVYVGGVGVSRGYFLDPEATAERFIPHAFSHSPGVRLYRTGDLACYHASGLVEFVGKKEAQIKVNGYRIVPGAIEAAVLRHPSVHACVVLFQTFQENDFFDTRLVAYVVPDRSTPMSQGDLYRHLLSQLPAYMIPAHFVLLDALPLTPQGKLDRQALFVPTEAPSVKATFSAPRTLTEMTLASIWSEVLGKNDIGTDDHFFQLEGHSLLVILVLSRVHEHFQVQLPIRSFFENPTIAGLARLIEAQKQDAPQVSIPLIAPVSRERLMPLSFAQMRMWFMHQLEPENPFYNIFQAKHLRGSLNMQAFERSLQDIIRRHETLRTRFCSVEGEPWSMIEPEPEFPFLSIDLENFGPREQEKMIQSLMTEAMYLPFDLLQDRPIRVHMLHLGPQDTLLLVTMHHIISDGWSMHTFFEELIALYNASLSNGPYPLQALLIQYADYAAWQHQWLQEERLAALLAYWMQNLQGAPFLLNLPAARPRTPVQRYQGASWPLRISASLTQALKDLSQTQGMTLFMTLMTAFALLLHFYSGQKDIVIGTDVANRSLKETEGLIGFFVNMLTLRSTYSGDPELREMLSQTHTALLNAYTHQDLPFEKLVEALQPQRTLSYHPIFQIVFVFQVPSRSTASFSGIELRTLRVPNRTSRFDIVLDLAESEDGLDGNVDYNTDLFDATTMRDFAASFQVILEKMVTQQNLRLQELNQILSAGNHERFMSGMNDMKKFSSQMLKRQASRMMRAPKKG